MIADVSYDDGEIIFPHGETSVDKSLESLSVTQYETSLNKYEAKTMPKKSSIYITIGYEKSPKMDILKVSDFDTVVSENEH